MPWVTIAAALLLAVLTPITLVMIRHEIRLRRIRLIDAFKQNFDAIGDPGCGARAGAAGDEAAGKPRSDPAAHDHARHGAGGSACAKPADGTGEPRAAPERSGPSPHGPPGTITRIPSFEYVLSKYAVDLDTCPEGIDRGKLRALDLSDPGVDDYISGLRWLHLRSNRRILWASLPYMVCCFFGFLIVFWPLTEEGLKSMATLVAPVLPTNGGLADAPGTGPYGQHFRNVLTIAAIGFVGAYLFTLRIFVRAVTVFDLSAITMLRATVHVLFSVACIVVIYRAMPSLGTLAALNPFADAQTAAAAAAGAAAIPTLWLMVAFLFGFFPDSALRFMISRASHLFAAIKTMDDRFVQQTRSTPLEVIDGIDFPTRFRLEEANVCEVQNLACANPIMLHIETPYGIYQTIDWVAQAQLCTVVGPERFLVMRQFHIRTIFDLERAVLSGSAPAELRRFVALLLLMPTEVARTLVNDVIKTSFPDGSRTPPGLIDFDAMNLAAGILFAAPQAAPQGAPQGAPQAAAPGMAAGAAAPAAAPGAAPQAAASGAAAGAQAVPDAAIAHLVRIIVDDLHVHRLRQIWMAIALRLGGRAASLGAMEEPGFYR